MIQVCAEPYSESARGADSVAPFIYNRPTVNERSESNTDCSFHYSIATLASGRSYLQNLLTVMKTFSFEEIFAYTPGFK